LSALLAGINTQALAQDNYPSKPVHLIVTGTSGTATYLVARIYADKLSKILGQTVIVEARAGAGGSIASQAVASAPADGYTLLFLNSSHSANPSLYAKLPYDTLRDFVGVALVTEQPYVALVHPSLGVRTLKEFIALAKKAPGTINYVSNGVGSATHLSVAYFASLAGIDLTHVPYKDASSVTMDFLSGRVQFAMVPVNYLLPQIKEGKVFALAVTSPEPMHYPLVLPSVREVANLDYAYSNWYGFVAAAKTPPAILNRLSRAIQEVSQAEDTKTLYKTLGLDSRVLLLQDFDAFIKADMDKTAALVKSIGLVAK